MRGEPGSAPDLIRGPALTGIPDKPLARLSGMTTGGGCAVTGS
jgi:hypothetical protein